MTLRGEYCTIADLRSTYLGATGTGDDPLLLDMVRAISRDIDDLSVKRHFPRVETRYFDVPAGRDLYLDDWLLAVTTLTNGDAAAVASSEYNLHPRNQSPYEAIKLKQASDAAWEPDSEGNTDGVITLAGIWGYHREYAHAWESLTTLSGALTSSATALTLAAAGGKAGELWKIDSEFIYAGTVLDTAASALVRGVNGSTAAAHDSGATIYKWTVPANLELLARQAAAATYKLRDNPQGESVTIDGHAFHTPRDVRPWLAKQLAALGLVPAI